MRSIVRNTSMSTSLNVRRHENSHSSSESRSTSISESINPVSNKSVVSEGTTTWRRCSNIPYSLRQMVESTIRLYSVYSGKVIDEATTLHFLPSGRGPT